MAKNNNDKNYEVERNRIKSVLVAAEKNELETLQNLSAEYKIDILDYKDGKGQNPLHAAARAGSYECLKWMIEQRPDLATIQDVEGRTPLMSACITSQGGKCVDLLLKHYKTLPECENLVNCKQANDGGTALHLAACCSLESCKALLSAKADVNANSLSGTPLLWCCAHAPVEIAHKIAQLLVEEKADANFSSLHNEVSALIISCLRGDAELANVLIEKGNAKLDYRVFNLSPLHAAAASGNLSCVQLLVEKVTKTKHDQLRLLQLKDLHENLYPIEHAAFAKHFHVVEYLLPFCESFLKEKSANELITRVVHQVEEVEDRFNKILIGATEQKLVGNQHYEKKDFVNAIEIYNQALQVCLGELKDYLNGQAKVSKLKSVLYGNISACCLGLKHYEQAVENAKASVNLDDTNVKSHYRLGLAYSNLGNHQDAAASFYNAYDLESKNHSKNSGAMLKLFQEQVQLAKKQQI